MTTDALVLRSVRLAEGGGDPVDVTVRDGRIASIGVAESGIREIDAQGRWLVPGLWDQHVHFSQWAMNRMRVDLSSASSAREAATIMAAAPRPPEGVALVGGGFRDGLWPDTPAAAVLDAVLPDLPVVLISGDLHSCWLNSVAMRRFGMSEALIKEEDCFAVVRALDDVPEAVLDGWVADAARAAAARGVVGIVDLEMNWGFDHWMRRMAAGVDALRVRPGVYPHLLDRAIEAGYRTGDRLGELLEVGPFKIITDGSLNTRTAYCHDPYPGTADRGLLTVPTDELEAFLRRATGGGLTPAVHAIGDDANGLALDVFERLGVGGRIEHAQLLTDADVARFAALGVAGSVQPEHLLDDRDVADRYWAGRTGRAFPLRSLLDAGARLLLGSDAPVAPLDPWVAIAAAVTRTRDGREPWHPEQRISVAEALAASAETTIAVGQPADLALVDENPHTTDDLRRMPVAATLLAGHLTHSTL